MKRVLVTLRLFDVESLSDARSVGAAPLPLLAQSTEIDLQKRNLTETEAQRRARIRTELAIGYFQEGRYSIALDELKQALSSDPNHADALGILALVYMELGEKALAEQNFRRAMQIKPDDSDLNVNYGWFLCSNGRERESIPHFLAAIKNPLYARPALAWQNAGVCALKLKDVSTAENYLRRSYEIDPDGVVTSVKLASIYYDRGEFERARFLVSNINKSPAAWPESLWLGARIERKLGNRAESDRLGAQLRRTFPNSAEAAAVAKGAFDE